MLQNIFSTVLQLHLLQFTCTGEKHIFGPQRILWWWLGRYKSWFQSLALFLWACLHQVNGCSTIALGKQLGKESLFLCWLMRADLLSLCCNSTFVFSREKVWILFPPLDKPLCVRVCVRVCVRAQFFLTWTCYGMPQMSGWYEYWFIASVTSEYLKPFQYFLTAVSIHLLFHPLFSLTASWHASVFLKTRAKERGKKLLYLMFPTVILLFLASWQNVIVINVLVMASVIEHGIL